MFSMRKSYSIFITLLLILSLAHTAFSAGTNLYSDKLYSMVPDGARENGKLGVVVKSLRSGQTIFEHNPERMFIPASNEKIITSVAALSLLGKDYRFKTEFYSGGEISNGVLHGGLYIKGYGDPTLSDANIGYLVYKLKHLGVKQIKGGIIVDDEYFSKIRRPRGWKQEWKDDFYSPPISALSLNYNVLEITVSGTGLGKNPAVMIHPKGSNIKIINRAVTSKKKSVLTTSWQGSNSLILDGRIRPRGNIVLKIPVSDPAIFAGGVIKGAIEAGGIAVEGQVEHGTVPRWANSFYTHHSEPLNLVVTEYNKNSVNVIGENLMKTMGAKFKGAPGTWTKGSQVISEFLNQAGIEDGYTVVDGSGLSLLNRVSPDTLTRILSYAYNNHLISSEFMISLPVAGVDGTLRKRFKKTAVQGRVMAKTGYLRNVRALSGFIYTMRGDVLVFSILSNGLGPIARTFQQELLTELVNCCVTDDRYYH